ncbi:mep operon protein MepB, partial [Bacillus thuringiensis]
MNKGGVFLNNLNNFNNIIQNLNNIVYKPNNLMITNLKEEKQNAEYAGCLFHLNNKT